MSAYIFISWGRVDDEFLAGPLILTLRWTFATLAAPRPPQPLCRVAACSFLRSVVRDVDSGGGRGVDIEGRSRPPRSLNALDAAELGSLLPNYGLAVIVTGYVVLNRTGRDKPLVHAMHGRFYRADGGGGENACLGYNDWQHLWFY